MKEMKSEKRDSATRTLKILKRYLSLKVFKWLKGHSKIEALTCLGLCLSLAASAQNVSGDESGKVILQSFMNFHAGFGSQTNDIGFDLDRTYLGYEYNFGNGLSVKGVMDVGAKTDGYDRIAYIKNAQITWKRGNWTLNGGLISTTQFNMVEKFWGYRYIYKSFQDQYSFGSSADLGISVAYQPAKWISIDAIIVNGEGYKKVQYEDGLLYGLGTSITPVKGLTMRAYASFNDQPDDEDKGIFNLASFVGYKGNSFAIGAEYNYMQNAKGVEDHDRSGLSVYGSVNATDWCSVFVRYDDIFSKENWAGSDDERVVLVGTQFKLGKHVKLAPNFRLGLPKEGGNNEYSAYISCSFGL